eukprot:jgi/Tetstr1/445534/TSEL_033308.t2
MPSTEHNPVNVDLYGDALMILPAHGDAHWRVQHDAIADAFRDHCVHDMGIAVRREVDDLFQQAVPLGNTVPMDELKDLVPDAELSLPASNVVTGSYDPRSLKSTLMEFKTMRYGVKYTIVPRATAVDRFERSLLGDIQRGLAARDAAWHNTEPGQKGPLRDIPDMSEYKGMVFGTVACIAVSRLVKAAERRGGCPPGRPEEEDDMSQDTLVTRPGGAAYTEGLPLVAQLLSLCVCLLGFNALMADPPRLHTELADLIQALCWGVVVLISFRSYRFDTVDGHTALQQSTSFTLDGHIDSTPIQLPLRPYPFIHSPLLLAVWVVRAAVAWGRASSSLLKIHDGHNLDAADFIWIGAATCCTLLVLVVVFVKHNWKLVLREETGYTERQRRSSISITRSPSLGAWGHYAFHPSNYASNLRQLEEAGWISRITFAWVKPLMERASAFNLLPADLFHLPSDLLPEECASRLWKRWVAAMRKQEDCYSDLKSESRAVSQLLHACMGEYGCRVMYLVAVKVPIDLLTFAAPLLLKELILWVLVRVEHPASHATPGFVRRGCGLVGYLSGTFLLNAILKVRFEYWAGRLGQQLRIAIICCIHRKTMGLRQKFGQPSSTETVQQLLAKDADSAANLLEQLHYLWSLPLQLTAGLGIIFYLAGSPAFVCILLPLVLLTSAGWWLQRCATDAAINAGCGAERRMMLITEVIRSIPSIKVLAFEDIFLRHIRSARQAEMQHAGLQQYSHSGSAWIRNASGMLLAGTAFGLYCMQGGAMRAEIVFPVLSIVSILISVMLKAAVNLWDLKSCGSAANSSTAHDSHDGQMSLSVPLLATDHGSCAKSSCQSSQSHLLFAESSNTTDALAVSFVDATFAYLSQGSDCGERQQVLKNANLRMARGLFYCIIGAPCMERDLLLEAMCGELQCEAGDAIVAGRVAYAPLQPHVLNSSLRVNVLFGNTYDASRYQKVMDACALDAEVRLLPQGDLTIVGERGRTLSASLLARLSLARAMYQDADIYIFDDILAELSHSMVCQLLENALLSPLLAEKTRVLVSNHLPVAKAADLLLLMEGGTIHQGGSWEQVLQETETLSPQDNITGLLPVAVQQIHSERLHRGELSAQDLVLLGDEGSPERKEEKQEGPGSPSYMAGRESPGRMALKSLFGISPEMEAHLAVGKSRFSMDNAIEPPHARTARDLNSAIEASPGGASTSTLPLERRSSKAAQILNALAAADSATAERSDAEVDRTTPRALTPVAVDADATGLCSIEEDLTAPLKLRTYMSYTMAAGWGWILLSLSCLVLMQSMRSGVDLWLAQWVTAYHKQPNLNSTASSPSDPGERWTVSAAMESVSAREFSTAHQLRILCLLAVLGVLFAAGRELGSAIASLRAAKQLHEVLLRAMLTLPLPYFNPHHVRQTLNSLSSDISTVDSELPAATSMLMDKFAAFLGLAAVLGLGQAWHFIALLPGAIIISGLRRYYTSSCTELSRVEKLTRTPVISLCIETIPCASTIRAHGVQAWFQGQQHNVARDHMKAKMALLAAKEWLSFRVQVFSALLVGIIGCLTVADAARVLPGIFRQHHMSIGVIGLSLCYTLSLCDIISEILTASAATDKHMASVERILLVSDHMTEPEADRERIVTGYVQGRRTRNPRMALALAARRDRNWPHCGEILFENVTLHYEHSFTPALDRLTLSVPAGTKVGVVGRTGSGKSSLLGALLRMWQLTDGAIYIDSVDISQIPVRRLRRVCNVIPQQPFLFRGSLRENLDPYGRFTDAQIKAVLQTTNMYEVLRNEVAAPTCLMMSFSAGASTSLHTGSFDQEARRHTVHDVDQEMLTKPIGVDGLQLSTAQAQLLCLARILLCAPRIVCLDEATAAVDPYTSSIMQKAIHRHLAHSTCLQVARRLDDIMSCSSVVVMGAGRVVERGNPEILLRNPNSHFAALYAANIKMQRDQAEGDIIFQPN